MQLGLLSPHLGVEPSCQLTQRSGCAGLDRRAMPQHDDLVKAKEQLLEVIEQINTETTEMFKATFEQIRDNFRTDS